MSSERFEYAEDELEVVLERLASALTQLGLAIDQTTDRYLDSKTGEEISR